MPISPARIAAFDLLLELERHGGHAGELLRTPKVNALSERDRNLATDIVMGVLRWRSRLDDTIETHTSKPLAKLDLEVLTALRMAVYQFRHLDRVPASAVVNDGVSLVKRGRKTSAAGFVNGVLRKIERGEGPVKAFPVVGSPPIPLVHAHPEWLVERWIKEFGFDAAEKICAHDQQVPSTALRFADPAAAGELEKAGIELAPGRLLRDARIVVKGDVTKTKAFREDRVRIQDEGSQLTALLVGHGERILDCCAAPGGKTLLMAERNPHASIFAIDKNSKRAAALRQRVHGANIEVRTTDARELTSDHRFDRALADVPCSGTGTLARNPEIKWRLSPDGFQEFQRDQYEILMAAIDHLQPGGRVLYSTCSLEREENEQVVGDVIMARSDVRLVHISDLLIELRADGEVIYQDFDLLARGPCLRTVPGMHPCDGFFAAALERL